MKGKKPENFQLSQDAASLNPETGLSLTSPTQSFIATSEELCPLLPFCPEISLNSSHWRILTWSHTGVGNQNLHSGFCLLPCSSHHPNRNRFPQNSYRKIWKELPIPSTFIHHCNSFKIPNSCKYVLGQIPLLNILSWLIFGLWKAKLFFLMIHMFLFGGAISVSPTVSIWDG